MSIFGSPPRLWGKRFHIAVGRDARRFTPTPVGKTRAVGIAAAGVAVHPHACGENVRWYRLGGYRSRFTPTPVGKTGALHRASPVIPVHPHACGENTAMRRSQSGERGSPPRLWGKLSVDQGYQIGEGSPPRLWGKRLSSAKSASRLPVHPHACGENPSVIIVILSDVSRTLAWLKSSRFRRRPPRAV